VTSPTLASMSLSANALAPSVAFRGYRRALGALAGLLLGACAHAGGRQVINPPGIAPLVPAYSVAIRDGDLVFVSGMTGIKPGTQDIVAGGVGVQTRQTLENIQTSLKAAGATMADVGECTVFLVDMADYAAMNAEYIQFFRVDPPARATLAVTALPRPAARVEIKCTARMKKR
jgi:2-iminobutanoate/2-iminopropanoate deaminase